VMKLPRPMQDAIPIGARGPFSAHYVSNTTYQRGKKHLRADAFDPCSWRLVWIQL
jgi:hypothetical protein